MAKHGTHKSLRSGKFNTLQRKTIRKNRDIEARYTNRSLNRLITAGSL